MNLKTVFNSLLGKDSNTNEDSKSSKDKEDK